MPNNARPRHSCSGASDTADTGAVEKYLALRRKLESLQREESRVQGQADALHARMKKEFGCKDLGALERLVKEGKRELKEAEEELAEKEAEFDEKWKGVLDET